MGENIILQGVQFYKIRDERHFADECYIKVIPQYEDLS